MIANVRPVPQHSKCFSDLTLVYSYSPTLTMTPHATHCCLLSRMLLHSGWGVEWPTEWVCNRWRPRPALSTVCAEPNVLVHRGCAGWAGWNDWVGERWWGWVGGWGSCSQALTFCTRLGKSEMLLRGCEPDTFLVPAQCVIVNREELTLRCDAFRVFTVELSVLILSHFSLPSGVSVIIRGARRLSIL